MKRACCFLILFFVAYTVTAKECVILLHGMGRTKTSMLRMASYLEDAGYDVINHGYASTEQHVELLAAHDVHRAVSEAQDAGYERVHFVTHSLGGILTRLYLSENTLTNLGRVVMLSPPNQGSEVTDMMQSWFLYEKATGPAGQVLGTDTNDLPAQLPPPHFELGVITGDRTWNPLYSYWIPGADDGKVSVERAKVEGMKDFLVVHASHTHIMMRKMVIDQVIRFLELGSFDHDAEEHTEDDPPSDG